MKYLLLVIVVGLFFSCSDFLEPKSQSEYIPQDAVSLNEMLLGEAYPQAGDPAAMLDILSMLDDDICCTDTTGGSVGLNDDRNYIALKAVFSWQPDFWKTMQENSNYYKNYWETFYQFILGANAALDYIDDVSGIVEEKNLVKAQAYALRAFYYFQLVNLFGEPYNYNKDALGVPLKLTSAMENKEIPRNTVKEVYDQILKDLTEAENIYESLPENMQFRRDYRTNLPMVQLLRSRVLLYMEDWKNAAIYAQKVINNENFSLIDLKSLPAKTEKQPYYNFISMESSSECIWVFGSINSYLNFLDASLNVLEDPSNPLGDSKYTYKQFNASPELLTAYVEEDLRKENYILKGRNKENSIIYPDGYYPYGKFAISSEYAAVSGNDFAYAFRLSEAYLNLAEAAANDNDPKTALDALNTLRSYRFEEGVEEISGLTGTALVERIRLERRLELCYEGHRWFDLRRYGMPSFSRTWKVGGVAVQTYQLLEKDPAYTLPIPQEVLDRNRNLIQNKLANPR